MTCSCPCIHLDFFWNIRTIFDFDIDMFVIILCIFFCICRYFMTWTAVFIVTGALYNVQDLLVYVPEHTPISRLYVASPSLVNLQFENICIRSHDGTRLHAQFIRQPPHLMATVPTFVVFHGNAGNIGDRLPYVKLLYDSCNVNILVVEYRGYGKSCGRPSEQGTTRSFIVWVWVITNMFMYLSALYW